MTMVYDLLRPERLPHDTTTVRFEFTVQPKIYWLVMGGEQPELAITTQVARWTWL